MKRFLLLSTLFVLLFTGKGYSQFVEDFEGGIPADWATFKTLNGTLTAAGNVPGWGTTTTGTLVCEATTSAYIDRSNIGAGNVAEGWLVTPQITVPPNGRLYFTAKQTFAQDYGTKYIVRISTTSQTDISSFSEELELTEDQLSPLGWDECFDHGVNPIIDISDYSGLDVYIAFIKKDTQPAAQPYADRWVLDMVKVLEQCMPPTNLGAVAGSTTADLTWTGTASSGWEVEVLEGVNVPGTGSPTHTGNDVPFEVTGLVDSTPHTYYVRANCGDSTSPWAGPFTFTTQQIPVNIEAPGYSTSFETATHGWQLVNGTETNKWVVGTATSYGAGSHSLYISNTEGSSNNYSNTSTSIVHAYRDVQIPATATEIYFSFDWRGMGDSNDYFRIWNTLTSYIPVAGSQVLAIPSGGSIVGGTTANHYNNPGWVNKGYVVQIPTAMQGQVRRFIFEWRNNNSGGVQPPAAIDNINIHVITCKAPTNPIVGNTTTEEADFSWTAPVPAPASYDYYVTTEVGTPNNATTPTGNVATNSVTVDTLDPSTSYYFWVRSNCGTDGVSFWVGPIAFSTPPLIYDLADGNDYATDFDTAGNQGWTLSNGTQVNKWAIGTATSNSPSSSMYVSNNNGTNNAYTIEAASIVHAYKDFSVPAGSTELFLSYDWKNSGQANADYIRVWTVPASYTPISGTQVTAGTQRQQFGGNHAGQSNWTPASYIIPATDYQGGTVRLVFEWRNDSSGGTQPPGAIDNINFSVITCPQPYGVTAGTITDSTAEISWSGTSPLYEYYYSTSPTNPTETTPIDGDTANTTVTLTGLEEGTVYYFWVRGNCGTLAGESFWTGPLTFWTPQVAVTLPYEQDFEDDTVPEMMLFSGTQANKWVVGTATSSSPTHSSYVSFDGTGNTYTGTTSIVHTYRTFMVPAGTTELGISYDWKGTGDNSDYMNVWIVPDTYTPTPGTQITPASGGTLLAGIQNNQPSWKTNVHTVTGVAGTFRRLIFEWRNDTSVTNPPAAIDNIVIKVITCPQPTGISASNITDVSATLEWTEAGTATQWEYVILPIGGGLPGADPADGVVVDAADAESWDPATGEASFVATGLTPGVLYVYYVRAICDTDDVSFWTGPYTLLVNDDCDGAITVPVNPNLQCNDFVSGTVWGATASGAPSTCGGVADDDVWFEFEATSTLHILNFNNVVGSALYGTLYADSGDDCIAMVQQQCITGNQTNLNGLTVGQTYKLKVYTQTAIPNQTTTFDVCITTPGPPIYASITDYTVTELVTDVLINSNCAQVSNITWSTGSNFGSVNGIGYFEENNSGFPFEYGLVLSTGAAASVPGPNSTTLGDGNMTTWLGDTQLTTYLNAIIGTNTYYNATILEFDFVPLIDHISFDFMFASEEYGTFQCSYSDSFAFFLTNTTTGVTTNLALVPGTNDPISVVTIRDSQYNTGCASANVEYFGAYYPVSATGGAPINFNGVTVPMIAEADVTPGTTYHIKLVIQDRGDSSFDSAVFLNGGSFNIGDIELGVDLTVDDNTALCFGAQYLLQSGLDPAEYDFVWYFNGDIIDGADGADLTVSEPGEYLVEASFPNSVCAVTDSVIIEFYPPIELDLSEPDDLYICDDTETAIFDLTENIPVILDGLVITDFEVQFFVTQEDAEADVNPIANPEAYEGYNGQTIYVLVLEIATGCTAILEFNLYISPLGDPESPEFDYPTHILCSLQDEVLVSLTPEGLGGIYSSDPGLSLNATTGTINVSGSTPGIYDVTYTIAENACTSEASHTVTIEIIEPVPVDVTFSYDEVCINALSDPLPVLAGGFAQGGSFSSGTLDVNPQSGEVNLDTATIGTHEITYIIDANVENCTEAGSYTATIVIVEGTPSVTGFSYDAVYCYSDETAVPVMVADYTEGGTFSATPAGLNINAQTGVIDVTVSTPGTYLVTYAVSEDPEICLNAGSSDFTVTIFGEVPVAITDECRGSSYWLIASPVDGSYNPDEVVDYTWIINDISTVTAVPEFNISENMGDNTLPLEVTVIVNNGCDNYVQFVVTSTSCMIQKGISPNGDDMNDYFDLTGMGVKKLSIYSRYGREVYTKSNYVNEWNGQDKNDNELPTGTYFYSIERSNGENVTGWIYVNRAY